MKDDILKLAGSKFICGFDGLEVSDNLRSLIYDYHIGGVILFTKNIASENQVKHLTDEIKAEAEKAGYDQEIIIAIDQENGLVNRLSELDFYMPGSMSLGAADNYDLAYEVGYRTAMKLNELGINLNLAPVLDLNTNPNNPGVGTRSFSNNPNIAFKNASAFIKGHKDIGILTTLKHFPGLGELSVDTHFDLPEVGKSLDELEKLEIVPFEKLIKQNGTGLMTAHVRFPNIDSSNLPTTMSKKILTDLLRKSLGYNGVIITDCLEMHAISKNYGVSKGAKMSFLAGADIAIVSHTYSEQINAIKAVAIAMENGEINNSLVREQIDRIKNFKSEISRKIKTDYVNKFSTKEMYEKSVTILKYDQKISNELIYLVPYDERRSVGENKKDNRVQIFKKYIIDNFEKPEIYEYTPDNFKEKLNELLNGDKKEIVIGTLDNKKIDIGSEFILKNKNVHVISLRDPYPNRDLFEMCKTWIDTYDLSYDSVDVAFDSLFNKSNPSGKLPVHLHFR